MFLFSVNKAVLWEMLELLESDIPALRKKCSHRGDNPVCVALSFAESVNDWSAISRHLISTYVDWRHKLSVLINEDIERLKKQKL